MKYGFIQDHEGSWPVVHLCRLLEVQRSAYYGWRHPRHAVYPYLLRGLDITHPGQVWCADVTYSAPSLGRRLDDAA